MKLFFALVLMIAFAGVGHAQNISQTIKGQVIDQQSQVPLIGATVKVTNSNKGAVTDENGYYKIEGVPVGRVSLEVSYLGYKTFSVSNLELTSGKELVLNVELEEQIQETQEVVISAEKDKTTTNNDMVSVSGRKFSVEETQRYAGARDDPARMAANFAGVQGTNDQANDVVIRGNSPVELLWRLEGVDIPNPNHFGDFGSTGGPVSMLNANVLSNSDFLTGAFPADYGNALSGVFDLKMRNGNDEHYEFLGQFGFNGIELGAEGPFSKKNHSSFLINYRYSSLVIFEKLGINFGTGTSIPYYQDVNFKLNFPSKKIGRITVFGLAGKSSIDLVNSGDSSTNFYVSDLIDVYDRNLSGVLGVSHTYLFKNSLYGKFTVAITGLHKQDNVDSLDEPTLTPHHFYYSNFNNNQLFLSYFINKKFSAKNALRFGAYASLQHFNIADSIYLHSRNEFITLSDYHGNTALIQPYIEWQFKPNDQLIFNTGIHALYLALNQTYSIEPRLGMKWQFSVKQSLSFGYGLDGIMAPVYTYFKTVELEDHSLYEPNHNLGFTKSHQFVLGYDYVFSQTLRLKTEVYYQYVFNALVEVQPSSFSLLNAGSYGSGSPDSLYNSGIGRNYGLELTFEKFLDHGYYFLFTSSLFDSRYRGSDNELRNSAFNSHFIFNLLGGKDFELNRGKEGAKNMKVLAFDFRVTYAGGRLYTPIDLQQSILRNEAWYYWDRAYSQHFPNYFRADGRVAFRINSKKISQQFGFYIENMTNQRNSLNQRFDPISDQIITLYQLGFFPVGQYRIEF